MWWYLKQKSKKLKFTDPLSSKRSFLIYLTLLGINGKQTEDYVEILFPEENFCGDGLTPEFWAYIILRKLYWDDLSRFLSPSAMYAYMVKRRHEPVDHEMIPTYVNDFFG